jgi:hypothetical protein
MALNHYFGHANQPDALPELHKLYRMYQCKDIFQTILRSNSKYPGGAERGQWQ